MEILTEPEYSFTAAAEREIVRDVTEKRCNIGLDCDTELETDELLDGNILIVFSLRFHWSADSTTLVSLSF